MAVGDVKGGEPGEGALDPGDEPGVVDDEEDVPDVVVGRDVDFGPSLHAFGDEGVDRVGPAVGQEDGPRLRPERLDVAHAVVFLVHTGQLVFLDDVVEIILARRGGDQTDLDVLAPDLLVDVEVTGLVRGDRPFAQEAVEVLFALGVDGVRIEIGARRQVDLRLADVQERVGVAGRELPRLFRCQDVVGRGGDEMGEIFAGTDAPERLNVGHIEPPKRGSL